MYGYHPDTLHESVREQSAQLRRQAGRRRLRRVPLVGPKKA
jgi:hypothetical protein